MGQWRRNPTPVQALPAPAKPAARPALPGTTTPGQGPGHWEGGGQWRPRRWVPDAPAASSPRPPVVASSAPETPAAGQPPVTSTPVQPHDVPHTTQPQPFMPGPAQSGASGGMTYGDFNDPYNSYLASIPVMQNQMMHQIGDAMAGAGFTGNRWSSSAENAAGQIGAETSMKLNQMLNQTMYDQANRDLDRAMQTVPLQYQGAQLEDDMQRNRLQDLFGFGGWEQGRQDNFARDARDQFNQDRLGFLPLLLQFAGAQGTPSGGTPYQVVTDPGKAPTIPPELISLLGGLL